MRASLLDQTCPTHGKLNETEVFHVPWGKKIYVLCKSCNKARASKWYYENQRHCVDRVRKYNRNWYYENQRHCVDRVRKYNRNLREEILAAYGGRCECCGEDHFEFLTIDHTNGNGAEEKRKLFGHGRSGTHFYQWLKKQGYPKDGYRLLCFNCNCARGFHGFCPHNPEDIQDVDRSRMRQRRIA